ncbi:MAG: hypothetical protein KME16_03695 [Scytolyngbya sp. HA4215-MV1]|jgi:hypothetical protein|nr:hypothetical protein [Scytolyngbya sp. HA4215-MV1]
MTNLNNRETYSREPYREIDRDAEGRVIHTKEVVNPDGTNPSPNLRATSYHNGYFQGRLSEQRLSEETAKIRENDGAARGLMIGILLTALTGLVVGGAFWVSQQNQTPVPTVSPVTVPAPTSSTQPSQNKTTIIERTTERVPVQQDPVAVPNVNITVPGTGQAAPATTGQSAPSQSAPTNQSAPSQSGTSGTGTSGTGTSGTAPAPTSPNPSSNSNSNSGTMGN